MLFWETLGWMLWATVFIGYLFALFAIIGDLFRDRGLNGWWKALWVVFLIFLPFLTVLVYLIARGQGMAQRSTKAAQETEDAAASYIRQVAGKTPGGDHRRSRTAGCRLDQHRGVRSSEGEGTRLTLVEPRK